MQGIDSNYADVMESKDAKAFNEFNEQKKFFKKITYNQKGNRIDAQATDRLNRKCHIELKQRTGKYSDFEEFIKQFQTIYLDCGKLDHLSNIMMASGYNLNEQELFVSIFNDGNVICIHNLNQPQPVMWLPNQKVWNPAKKRFEVEHKVGLYWYMATVYEKNKDGKYVKWPEEKLLDRYMELKMKITDDED